MSDLICSLRVFLAEAVKGPTLMEDTFSQIMVKFWQEGDFLILGTMALADFRFSSLIRIYRPPKFRPKMLFSDWLDRFRSFFWQSTSFSPLITNLEKNLRKSHKKAEFWHFCVFSTFWKFLP